MVIEMALLIFIFRLLPNLVSMPASPANSADERGISVTCVQKGIEITITKAFVISSRVRFKNKQLIQQWAQFVRCATEIETKAQPGDSSSDLI